jgi:hypothetical protein
VKLRTALTLGLATIALGCVALDGRRAFYNPARRTLKPGEQLKPNARADREASWCLD